MTREERLAVLGEGLHTGWRKGTDARYARTIHKLITDMEPSEWTAYVEWLDDALGEVGYRAPDPKPVPRTDYRIGLKEIVVTRPDGTRHVFPTPPALAAQLGAFDQDAGVPAVKE